MGDLERPSWRLALLCALLVAMTAAANQKPDHEEQMQSDDERSWSQAFEQFKNGMGFFGGSKKEGKHEEEKRVFSAGSDPSFRKSSYAKSSHSSYSSGGAGLKTGGRGPVVASFSDGGCQGIPPTPLNSQIKCTVYSGCQATCNRQYKFPNGERRVFFTCVDGEWQVQGSGWTTIPQCEPICLPECQHNGICVEPNQCNCPETFSGPQCQFENKPCLNYPPIPMNSKRTCTPETCTVQCKDGHKFPGGLGVTNLICKDGVWVPTKPEWTSIPDCEPVCNPPCENGGRCLSFNKCQCPTDFRGPQCQYESDRCTMEKLDFNGGKDCTSNSETFSCSISCPAGVKFEFAPAPVYTCSFATGIFLPLSIPKCMYGRNVIVSKVTGSQRSYSYNSTSTSQSSSFFGSGMKKGGFRKGGSFESDNSYGGSIVHGSSSSMDDLIAKFHKGTSQLSVLEVKKASPGSCFTWGGSHFKTFDGKLFSFKSQCSYTLIKDVVDNTFTINLETSKECKNNDKNCYKKIKMFVEDKEFVLGLNDLGEPELTQNAQSIVIPSQMSQLSIQRVYHFVLVKLNGVGATLKWDTKNFFQVDVTEKLWNKTLGLCGRIDGHLINDFEKKDGKLEKTLIPFVNSWEVDTLGERCNEQASEEHPCGETTSSEDTFATQANKFCSKMLKDPKFSVCQTNIDANAFYETCRWDYCAAKSNKADIKACEALSVFFQECMRINGPLSTNWRDETFCPMSCTGGSVYKQCGPAVQATCASATISQQKAEICVEGCYCPDGTVLHNDTCIPVEQCPCRYRGKTFASGEKLTKGCNTCTCSGGQWQCTQVLCGARCSAIGDPHYVTFDGKRYDFMGKCSYYLVKTTNFTIEAENVACAGSISEALGFSAVNTGLPSCTKTLTITMGQTTIKLKQNREVLLNGEELTQLPIEVEGINIRVLSSIFLIVELPNGVEVWWDGVTRAYIDAPATMHGKTQGLCGTFNENQKDDFLTPEGDIEQSVDDFANKWKTQDVCPDVKEKEISHPCDKNMQNKGIAETHCKKLKGKLFSGCHWLVDVEPFYQDCLYDLCSCQDKIGSCLCPAFSAYAKECALTGAVIDWRHEIRECGVHCMGSQRYQVCGDSCSHSCTDISLNLRCKTKCVEGCNCPDGFTLDKKGECIRVTECPCLHNNEEYAAGHREVRAGNEGLELCTCEKARWKCHPATSEEIKEYPRSSNLREECSAAKNLEFTKCEPAEPITCKNMHESISSSPAICRPGCKCKRGFVLDTITKECVKPASCPCHHGGKSYGEGETMQENCNTCTCNAGSWTCENRVCAGICTAWGESHFKTFDGKLYDFHGTCDYMLAVGKSSRSESFEVVIQNVLCGSGGVTCAKSVTIRVGSGDNAENVILTKDKPVPNFIGLNRTTVRQAGLFVFVEVFDLGLVVQWDRGTRVYVKIDPKWKNRLRGLCGNYNDNELDDFQTPSGGLTEVSAKLFGDSWKLQQYCMESEEIKDTCVLHPSRKTWAMQKCGILKSEVFKSCHSEVPVGPYIDRCMFDTCGCDLGGDCECLCTSIAAYAQECNIHGLPIKWRSQELCPIQCDEECAHYSPCVATCPQETCDNMFLYKSMTQLCSEDACVEGCQLKSCAKGEIYNSLDNLKCIPKNTCKPICTTIDNKVYYEGDTVRGDECHTCSCTRHKVLCQGEPCTTKAIVTSTTPQVTEPEYENPTQSDGTCRNGWSKWISNDKPKIFSRYNDIEPLQSTSKTRLLKSLPCAHYQMVDIRCRTVGSHLPHKETHQDVECSLEKGLKCQGTPNQPCLDYEIQVKCQCSTPVETSTMQESEATPTPTTVTIPYTSIVTAPSMSCEPGWTKWFDISKPDRNGEFEETSLLRHSYSFCPDYMILDTECRTTESHDSSLLDVQTRCDKRGLRCKNTGRGDMMCQNYEVRFLCGCECQSGLGMENGNIVDSQISVSSFKSPSTLGNHARLNGPGAWIPEGSSKQWVQVSFNEPKNITGIDIQGNPQKPEWVEAFTVSWSNDGVTWIQIFEKDTNWPVKLKGNNDQNTVVRAIFPGPVVAQYIRIYPSFFKSAPAMRFEILGCDIFVETTTTQAPTTVIPMILPCNENGWTSWMSSNTPTITNPDEAENVSNLRKKFSFCDEEFITKINCRTANKHVSIKEAGQHAVTCDLNRGLQCNSQLQGKSGCLDYEVQYYCECDKTKLQVCDPIAPNTPHEEDCHKFRHCLSDGADQVVKTCGQYMMFNTKTQTCDWPETVVQIRPECAVTTTEAEYTNPPTTTEGTPTCVPGWSVWFNNSHPDNDIGDLEHLDDIREAGGNICDQKYVKKIQCKFYDDTSDESAKGVKNSVQKLRDFKESGDFGVTCKKKVGLTCLNQQQITSMCRDYAIRVLCECSEETEPPTPQEIATTTPKPRGTSRCPPGQKWEECAVACDQLCTSYEYELKQQGLCESLDGCIPGCVAENVCASGYKWREKNKCVHATDCTCVSKNGTIVKPGIVYEENECERCQCINNNYVCDTSICETTTELQFEVVTSENMSTPQSGNLLGCYHGWSNWKSESNLINNEDGDVEDILSYQNCTPSAIECRTVRDKKLWDKTGQVVACDLVHGLQCYHSQNFPEGCMDYEIRVNCLCSQTISTEPTIVIEEETTTPAYVTPVTITSTIVACDGWSQWFNDNNPVDEVIEWESKFDYELRKLGFCSHGEITDIECVEAKYNTPYTETGDENVKCNLISGLKCHNLDQDDGACKDYKVRYYCNCDKTTTMAQITIAPTTVSPPPPCEENKLLSLVNGVVPLPDTAFKASSSLNQMFGPHQGRITPETKSGHKISWVAASDDKNQYLQVDLGHESPVYGVVVQGNPITQQYVTSYQVMHSNDGQIWSYVTNNLGTAEKFSGPNDMVQSSKLIFNPSFEARYIRFIPMTWKKGIAMKVDVMGCGEMSEVTETISSTTIGIDEDVILLCSDEMGLEHGMLKDQQIQVSSVLNANDAKNGPKNLRLNGPSAWRPNENGLNEWVMIDFLEPRNISGVITQGDAVTDSWVESFKIKYSNDLLNWNPILDEFGEEKKFLGNFDSKSAKRNLLNRMVQARYFKIIPHNWINSIGMRLEILGCYEEYPFLPEITTMAPPECNACPNLPQEKLEGCLCRDGLLWDGESCVTKSDCNCYVDHIPYLPGTVYESEDCQKCVCKIGGHAECENKICPKCKAGEQSILTPTCGCVCKPCPIGKRLCQTSNVCLNESLWCDGIEECSDDEINCETTPLPETTTTPTTVTTPVTIVPTFIVPQECPPEPVCENGTLVEINRSEEPESATLSGVKGVKGGVKTGVKGGVKTGVKGGARNKAPKCKEYICQPLLTTPAPCPEPKCPPGYDLIKTSIIKNDCLEFRCELPPKDQVCKVEGRNFVTFDDTHYQYEICNHILAKDKVNKEWSISIHKVCLETNKCDRTVDIKHAKHSIIINPDLSITYDDYTFSIEQANTIGSSHQEFVISHVGDTIHFKSNHYGFWIIFDEKQNVKIGVPSKLHGQVNGLCGEYNGIKEDDKKKPDGTLSRSTIDFGDSWTVPGTTKEQCEEVICSKKHQDKAFDICISITTKNPLSLCKDVISIDHFVTSCIESVCKCLQHETDEQCKCSTALSFMKECKEKSQQLDLSAWRVEIDCPASCPPGLVYKDCYSHQCEKSCENLHDNDPCPKLENTCFSGCYCPDGLVRKGEKCVKPVECKDCVCTGFGDPQYLTFDRTNYTFNGNCTYVASRDIVSNSNKPRDYEVLVTNVECIEEPGTTCTEAVTVLYKGNIVHVRRVEGKKQILTHLNGQLVTKFPLQNDWLKLETIPKKQVTIFIPAIQLEVTYFYFNYAFVIRLPSHVYGDKIEGLCGDCNKNKTDDTKMRDGTFTNNTDDFGMSWLVKDLPPGLKLEASCQTPPKNECLPLPPNDDPCLWIMDEAKFGKCHQLVDPVPFIIACQFDVCHSLNKRMSACRDVEAYARECQQQGLCLDWRSDGLCPYDCPAGTIYKPCGSGCEETCDNFKQYRSNPSLCPLEKTEGCFCPEGEVFKHGKCRPESSCTPCDPEERYMVGDKWNPDNCTLCECIGNEASTSITCTKTECPATDTICKQGYKAELVQGSENDCCPKYVCVLVPPKPCPPIVTPQCGLNQKLVDISANDCPQVICQCVPKEECPPLSSSTSADFIDTEIPVSPNLDYFELEPVDVDISKPVIEPGMVKSINETGCCPHYIYTCNKTTCPKIECEAFYETKIVEGTESRCCPLQTCVPPKNLCVVKDLYIASDQGGERMRTEEEKNTVAKEIGATWRDGPCRSCECTNATSSDDKPTIQCSSMTCQTEEQHLDFKHYALEQSMRFGDCCPTLKRKACKDNDQEYPVGIEWPVPDDKCATALCVKRGDGIIEKQTKIQECNTDCELGWQYFPSSEESSKCCGNCRQVACIQEGKAHDIGTNWHSEDLCTQYFCVDLDGAIQIESNRKTCPDIPKDWHANFALKTYNLPGDCCNTTEKIACLYNGKTYKVGESWQSTEDKCKKYECVYDKQKVVQKQEQIEKCNTECKMGWEYVEENANSNKCCGECVQTSCIVSNELKSIGEMWSSEDNCTSYSCNLFENQISVSSAQRSCESVEFCEPEYIEKSEDGCCDVCKIPPKDMTDCGQVAILQESTLGIIKEKNGHHGKCINNDVIPNFKKCSGVCQANYSYNSILSTYMTDCKCCQPVSFDKIEVELTCEDDYKYIKKIKIPKTCSCDVCSASPAELNVKSRNVKSLKHPTTFLEIPDAYN